MAYQKLCGYCLEGTGQALPPLPQAHGQWQTPNCRHCSDRAGNVGVPVGDRTGSRAASGELTGSHSFGHQLQGEKKQRQLRPLLRIAGGRAPVGNPRGQLCGRYQSTPAGRSRQPRTNTRKCGIQSAHQSLPTVVSAALPPALRNSHPHRPPALPVRIAQPCPI